jgi:carboxyl-terminal processing protease
MKKQVRIARWRCVSALVALLVLAPLRGSAQADPELEPVSPRVYLEEVLDFISANSVRRDSVDWEPLRATARERAARGASLSDVHAVIRWVLSEVDDGHSRFFSPEEARDFLQTGRGMGLGLRAAFPGGEVMQVYPSSPADVAGIRAGDRIRFVDGHSPKEAEGGRTVELRGERIVLDVAGPSGDMRSVTLEVGRVGYNAVPAVRGLPGGVGYLLLPEYVGRSTGEGASRYVEASHADMAQADGLVACGWVVDLRLNSGGNMWPMLAAAGPLLGDGVAGSFAAPEGTMAWGYAAGEAFLAGRGLVRVAEPYVPRRPGGPVAVLTSRLTASAGEAVAIAFRGRDVTRSFGEPTRGIPTVNASRFLRDSALLALTTAFHADRHGTLYGGVLVPDEVVPIDWARIGTDDDPVLRAAARWIRSRPECGGATALLPSRGNAPNFAHVSRRGRDIHFAARHDAA